MAHGEQELLRWVAVVCGATSARRDRHIQTLWSGYGEIFRVRLVDGPHRTVVVKWVRPPSQASHPRGWSTSRSHARKLRSYEVETAFYAKYAPRTTESCRVPGCLGTTTLDGSTVLVLEDLDAAGFDHRLRGLSPTAMDAVLRFLAHFHATFLAVRPDGLWEQGTYWHLATRPDELEATTDPRLKAAAATLDRKLHAGAYRTLVHGDAKVANFCFRGDGSAVAAVDFQYIGAGCGMQDVAYFLSSCVDEPEPAWAAHQLDRYFGFLREALATRSVDLDALEAEWRALYPVAWADFARFLSGWAPGHWKLHGYTRAMVDEALR